MKVTFNVDCTPEEARAFLGLPDVTPINDKYVEVALKSLDGTTSLEQMESMFRSLAPMGDAGLQIFRKLMDFGIGGVGGGGASKSD